MYVLVLKQQSLHEHHSRLSSPSKSHHQVQQLQKSNPLDEELLLYVWSAFDPKQTEVFDVLLGIHHLVVLVHCHYHRRRLYNHNQQ